MKLLMTTDTVGGVFVYATQLAEALQRFDIEVVLATQGAPLADDQRQRIGSLANVTLYESQYRLEWMQQPWEDVDAAGRWLQWIADRERPDLIHLNDYAHGALRWNRPVLMVAHSCVYSWFRAVRGSDPGAQWRTYRARVRRGVRGADVLVAPTQAMLRAITSTYGTCRRRCVVPNGREPLKDAPTSGDKTEIVLAAGRVWDEAKNIALLARSATNLRWPVYVAGQCEHPEGGQCHFDDVHFLGRLAPEDLDAWYRRAAIYALPARYEPFGLTPLEAALAGCALVLGDIPSLREVWGKAATFVPPEDDQALADAINRLADHPSLRSTMADRARSRARQLTAARMARGYHNLYRQLLMQKRRTRVATPVLEET